MTHDYTVLVAVIGAVGLILSGVLVALIQTRKHTARITAEMNPNHGSSMRDVVNRIELDVREMRNDLSKHSERLAVVEVLTNQHRNGAP